MKVAALAGLGHLPQQILVDAKLRRHQDAVAELVFLGDGDRAAPADADRIQP